MPKASKSRRRTGSETSSSSNDSSTAAGASSSSAAAVHDCVNAQDPVTLEDVVMIPPADLVRLAVGGRAVCYDRSSFCSQVKAAIEDGKTYILVRVGETTEALPLKSIHEKLMQCPTDMQPLLKKSVFETTAVPLVEQLGGPNRTLLLEKMLMYLEDLRNHKLEDSDNMDTFFLTPFYFTPEERDWLLTTLDASGRTAQDHFKGIIEKLECRTRKNELCASHDVFPMYVDAWFGNVQKYRHYLQKMAKSLAVLKKTMQKEQKKGKRK